MSGIGNQTIQNSRSSKDMVLSMLAEQNIDIIEGLETLRSDTKNSSVEFAAIMESCFLAVSDDIKYALKANQEAIADLSVPMDTKFKEIDDKFKDDTESNAEQGNLKKTPKESKAKPCNDNLQNYKLEKLMLRLAKVAWDS